jgi:hypothetical protein
VNQLEQVQNCFYEICDNIMCTMLPYTESYQLNKHKTCSKCGIVGTIADSTFPNKYGVNRCTPCFIYLRTAWRRIYRLRLRMQFLIRYGKKCACCGEDDPWFLGIDHIHGRAKRTNDHRSHAIREIQRIKAGGWKDKTIQILCMNCNWAKGQYGICPHQLIKNS